MLADLVSETKPSQLSEVGCAADIRILKNYDFFKGAQMELV